MREAVNGADVLFLDTMLRYYLHINPQELEDEEWAFTIKYLKEIRKLEAKANE